MISTVTDEAAKTQWPQTRNDNVHKISQSLPNLHIVRINTEYSEEDFIYPNAFIPTLDYLHSQGIESKPHPEINLPENSRLAIQSPEKRVVHIKVHKTKENIDSYDI